MNEEPQGGQFLKKLLRALKSVLMSLFNMDYQMEGQKVTWFDNPWGWLERLVKKLRKWIEEE